MQLFTILSDKYSDNAVVMELGQNIKEKAQAVIDAVGPNFDKAITREIRLVDEKRDSVFRMIYNIIGVYSNENIFPDNYVKGRELLDKLAPGGISFLRGPDLEETTLIEKALIVLKSKTNIDFIKNANAENFVNELESLNNKFKDLYQSRIDTKNDKLSPVKFYDIPFNHAISSLLFYLSSLNFENKKLQDIFRPLIDAYRKKNLSSDAPSTSVSE